MAGKKGRSGRPTKDLSEHFLDGTYKPCRHDRKLAGEGKLKQLAPLAWTNFNNEEKEIFNRFATYLYDRNQTEDVDVELLTQLVNYQYVYQKCVAAYKQDINHMFGKKLAVNVASECAKEIRLIMNEFHMTPSSRVVVKNTEEEKPTEDPVADFLKVVS